MAEQATLEILVKEGSGGSLLGRGPQPVPLSPSMPPSDWMQRLSESIRSPSIPIGRHGQVQAPAVTEVAWKKGMEPPAIRATPIPHVPIFQKDLQGTGETLKKNLGGLESPLTNLAGGLGKLGLATVGVTAAISLSAKVIRDVADYQLRTYRGQIAMRVAANQGDYIQQQIEKTMQPNIFNYIPGVKEIREILQQLDKAKLEGEKDLRQSLEGAARRLAPVSGPIAAGQAQAEAIRLRGQIAEAQIAGPALGRFAVAQAREQAARDRLDADRKKWEAETKARDLENRASLAEVAANTRDPNKRARIVEALQEQLLGNFDEFNKLLREVRDEIKKIRENQDKEFLEKPLSWFDDIVNGERGRPNFSGVPTDLVRETMRQQISPAF